MSETKFNYEDTKFYAEKLRGHCNTSGPWWSTLLRFVPMFDEVTRLQSQLDEAKLNYFKLADVIAKESSSVEHLISIARQTRLDRDEAREENKTLRKALEDISTQFFADGDDEIIALKMRNIARAALNGGK